MTTPAPYDPAAFQAEVDHLAKIAATSTDECVVATLIAAQNKHVQERVVEKAKHYVWKGLFCDKRADGKIAVVFNFECHPGQICLVKPWFAAVVDLEFGTVYGIQDPYRPGWAASSKPCICAETATARRRPECVVCQNTRGYNELVDALKKAKNKGAFGDKGGCKSFCDNHAAAAAYLADVLGLAGPALDLALLAIDACGHCACDYDVF